MRKDLENLIRNRYEAQIDREAVFLEHFNSNMLELLGGGHWGPGPVSGLSADLRPKNEKEHIKLVIASLGVLAEAAVQYQTVLKEFQTMYPPKKAEQFKK